MRCWKDDARSRSTDTLGSTGMMTGKSRIVAAGAAVFFDATHAEVGREIASTIEGTAVSLGVRWGLKPASRCEAHVLLDWEEFVEDTVPSSYRLLVQLGKPLWRGRAKRTFEVAGGWMLPWPGRLAIGVKPPELLTSPTTELGARLFESVSDPMEKVRHTTCHEYTHACTAHLRLPAWLNEGLAMRAVDHLFGRQTVRQETRGLVVASPSDLAGRAYRRVRAGDAESLLALYATGYWVTRRLEQSEPETLREILTVPRRRSATQDLAGRVLGRSLALWGGCGPGTSVTE